MNDCIIVGAGTYGQVYAKYLSDSYNILGFVDDDESLHNVKINGHNVLGNVTLLFEVGRFTADSLSIFVPIGNNEVRTRLLNSIRDFGYKTPSYVHSDTIVDSSVEIGDSVYILPGTSIMPYSSIANNVMISMGVNIAHHVKIEEGCFFSQGSNIGASMIIERLAYIGIASIVMTGVKRLGASCLIGAGSVVIRDVPNAAVIVGNPGKILKFNKPSN